MLNKIEEELPSTSDIAKADNIELEEFMENAMRSMENLIKQFEGEETLPRCELQGLDKRLRSIRGSLRVEVVKKAELKKPMEQEKHKLEEIQDNHEYDDAIREAIKK